MSKKSVICTGLALLLCTGMSANAAIPLELQNKVIGVRLEDVMNASPSAVLGLPNLVPLIKKNPGYFFTQGEVEVVNDVFFRQMPDEQVGQITLEVTAFVKYKNSNLTFEKLQISYPLGSLSLQQVYVKNEAIYTVRDMNFTAKVGLIDRKLILEDKAKDVKLVFPIGVGSFDEGALNEGKISLLTPRFTHAFIDQRAVDSKREKPRYFQGKPFIRIQKGLDLTQDATPIGFHIEINDSFVRGFDSHGCMRLREMDLMAFHDLIVFGSQQKTPLTIQYRLNDLADNPVAKRNKTYKTVLNKGTFENPFFILDKDNLIQLVYKENTQAPVDKLIDTPNDNYYDLLNYDTTIQMREQDARRKNECDAKVMSGAVKSDEKSYQECLDEGKRKDSFKDRIYRKYMGIDEVPSYSNDGLPL